MSGVPQRGFMALGFATIGAVLMPFVGSIIAIFMGKRAEEAYRRSPDAYSFNAGKVARVLGWAGLAFVLVTGTWQVLSMVL